MNKKKLRRKTFLYKIYLYYFWIKYKIMPCKKSYSQLGEDVLINNFFKKFKGRYVDIGCFNPIKYNNTMLLYLRGWRGTNIDLNPTSIDLFKIIRKNDNNIVACLSNKKKIITIYYDHLFSALNSVYLENSKNFELKNLKKVKTKTKIFSDLVKDKFDFLNIDCEGSDYQILKTIDLNFYTPKLICIEINSKNKRKIFQYLNSYGYKVLKIKKVSYIFKKIC